MLVHLSVHTPRPEHEQDLVASMQRFAAAAGGLAGTNQTGGLGVAGMPLVNRLGQ